MIIEDLTSSEKLLICKGAVIFWNLKAGFFCGNKMRCKRAGGAAVENKVKFE